jgi:hypothetical protein
MIGPPSKSFAFDEQNSKNSPKAETMVLGYRNWLDKPVATLNASLHEFLHAIGMMHPHRETLKSATRSCWEGTRSSEYNLPTLMNYCYVLKVSRKTFDDDGYLIGDDPALLHFTELDKKIMASLYSPQG